MASITCKLKFRWAFAVRFHKLGFCLSQFLHHFFVVLFHLHFTLEIRVSPCFVERRRRLQYIKT